MRPVEHIATPHTAGLRRVNRKRLLVVSNGYGEDVGAAQVVRALRLEDLDVIVYPLVGLGSNYPPGVALLEPRREFPSGGFGWIAGWRSLREDLAEGLLKFWLTQRRVLRAQRGRVDLVVAAGDVYCLAMASAAGGPTVFLAGSKSQYLAPYNRVEVWMLRRLASQVFTRDEVTAAELRRQGVNAEFRGFWMMDALRFSGETFGLPPSRPAITLLPGSKSPAFDNLIPLLRAANMASAQTTPPPAILLAWAAQLPLARLRDTIAAHGGVWVDPSHFRFQTIEVIVTTEHYSDALRRATAVLGMAGAANEHAAGLGKPVVAFPGTGPQFRPDFLEGQRRLLGDSLVATATWEAAGAAVAALLANPQECERRGQIGRARQGGPGGAGAIASYLFDRLGLNRLTA
jgi:uncharacterized protein (TIGR03492 family)